MSPEALDDKSRNQLKVAREPISRRSFQAGRAALSPQTRGRGAESASDCPRAGTRPGATWASAVLAPQRAPAHSGPKGVTGGGEAREDLGSRRGSLGRTTRSCRPLGVPPPLLLSSGEAPTHRSPPSPPPIGFSWVLSELKDLRGAGAWLSSQLPEAAWDPLARAPSSRREPAATCRQHLQGRLQEVRRAPGVFQAWVGKSWDPLRARGPWRPRHAQEKLNVSLGSSLCP